MQIEQIDEHIIRKINAGDEKAFSKLYEAYYVYLNSIAIYYVIDSNIGGEVVDDVFMNIWNKKHPLVYPVHSYLIRSVQNGCLNYIRSQQVQQQVYDEHKERLLSFHERHILSTPVPLQYVEMRETENQIRAAVDQLPSQCRAVFEAYFYSGKSVDTIANEFQINIGTVRVQLKKAIDRLKPMLKHLLIIFFV
ncbi:MAG: RNA polymerase sigma factor [Tannerellaceae bacterium]|jgi:RNA polymerase sigma-70 factor (family 1)|nr:RNA polymerase sigma factor [Tannerellaceae bacterium]